MGLAIQVFTSVLIVACPCALALAEPFANGSMMRWFGRYGFYLKGHQVLSVLHKINQLVFDKTGTLTFSNQMDITWHGNTLDNKTKARLLGLIENSNHPLSAALRQNLIHENRETPCIDGFKEYPGKGITGHFGEHVLALGNGTWLGARDGGSKRSKSFLKLDDELLGYFEFGQKLRPRLKHLMQTLKSRFSISLLSGDNDYAKKEFEALLGENSNLIFEAKPQDKLNFIKNLQADGQKVMMIGDGLNDAGALKQSDVGISLCEKDVNYFPASDALLMADKLKLLPRFLHLSQINRKVIVVAFIISFAYNIVGLSFAATGNLSPLVAAILMPISSVTVVLFTTIANAMASKKTLKTD